LRVQVVEYNDSWKDAFQVEAASIQRVFGSLLLALHHIGSTSVPGLRAKPIIDMLGEVSDIRLVDSLRTGMQSLGYEVMGEFGIPGRRYFRKGGDNRTHHLHVFEHTNGAEVQRHLAFRDYLIAHPEQARRYSELKSELVAKFPDDWDAYSLGKDDFIKNMEQDALRWYSGRNGSV